jgi:hypothetical protein
MSTWLPNVQQLLDIAIAITLVEVLLLWLYHRYTGAGLAPRAYLFNVTAGLALMLAARFSLAGLPWVWALVCLLLAGLAHLADMRRRWPARA